MTKQTSIQNIKFPDGFNIKAFSEQSGIPLRTLTRAKTGEGVGKTSTRLIEQELAKALKKQAKEQKK